MTNAVKVLLGLIIVIYFLLVVFADPPTPDAIEGIKKFPGIPC